MKTANELKSHLKKVCMKNSEKQINSACHYFFHKIPIPKELEKYSYTGETKK